MMDDTKVVYVLIPYTVSYILKRGRTVHTEVLSDVTGAVVRSPGPDDARIAFWLNSCRLVRPHIPQTGRHEVVYYDGRLWWPMNPKNDLRDKYRSAQEHRPIEENIDADELVEILRTGSSDLLGTGIDWSWGPRQLDRLQELEPTVREWKGNNREQMIALAQKRVSENLMVWNGRAYALGGEPVYVQHPFRTPGCSDDGMASVGHDRAVEATASGLPIEIGRNEFGQAAFMRGWFQRADQYGLAKSRRATVSQQGSRVADYIDVVLPEAVKFRQHEIRLDALFRAVHRFLLRCKDPAFSKLRSLFRDIGKRDCTAANTSRDRYAALVAMRDQLDSNNAFRTADAALRDAYESFKEFSWSGAFAEFERSLEEEDERALVALAPQ